MFSWRTSPPITMFGGPSGGYESAGGSAIWDEMGTLLAAAPTTGEHIVLASKHGDRWRGETIEAMRSD
jgi:hypothetical protein